MTIALVVFIYALFSAAVAWHKVSVQKKLFTLYDVNVYLVVAWFDWWVGAYYQTPGNRLYIMVPYVGIMLDFGITEFNEN